ncbi:MAG: hypothetical protein PUD16_02825 [bacterium]|nr:hypothetical protein [bacterium]
MAILGNNLKTAFLKGMEALGKGAANLTSSAQQKLNEMNLENRRSELAKEIPVCAMKLWKDGAQLPEELAALLSEISELEEQLAAMRAKPEAPAQPEAAPAAEETTVEEAVESVGDAIEEAVDTAEEVVDAMVDDVKEAVEGFFQKDEEEAPADDDE